MPGIYSSSLNQHAQALQQHPWSALPKLLCKSADRVIGDMLLHCGVFQHVAESSNLTQLSGIHLCELKSAKAADTSAQDAQKPVHVAEKLGRRQRGLSDSRCVRHRMLYARPTLHAKRNVSFGLGVTHVLNRYSDIDNDDKNQHVLRYIFPRQFGLHNAFTSDVDRSDTAQPFKDYTFREQEILKVKQRWKSPSGDAVRSGQPPIPRRLRTQALQLVHRLRKRHAKCSYSALMQHYCPLELSSSPQTSSFQQATPVAQVSAFCRAAVAKVFPTSFWGEDDTRTQNLKTVMCNIDRFIRLRRYESLSIHDVLHGIQIENVSWLALEATEKGAKMSRTDFAKRHELMAELLYYLFDSFLIPLIRGHFHVTESGAHRNQLFYFRHDVWKAMSEPALASLKESMLEPCNTADIKRKLATRALGVSRIRLLPKEQGMRPIINLRRRVQKLQQGRMVLGRSINSILAPMFSILNYEKGANESKLAAALFSVEDMYPRLQTFRQSLLQQGVSGRPLYFAKVDVKACFDTIPQQRLMHMARQIIKEEEYHITKYARAKLVGGRDRDIPSFGAKPSWKFLTKAIVSDKAFNLDDEMRADLADGRARSIYVDGGGQRKEQRSAILGLLQEHIESNLIKLGNRYYRQKAGIPQGSIVSSLLCSYFYSEMERQMLGFLNNEHTVLLRLIDDFLVISTEQGIAERFVRTMHRGIEDFGIEVKAEKSKVNFDIEIDGRRIGRLPHEIDFPYCGCAINTVTLNLSKDRERKQESGMFVLSASSGTY